MSSLTFTLPGIAHPAHVVPAQVHEHDMLGPLLGIGEQLLGKRLVLFLRRATAPAFPRSA